VNLVRSLCAGDTDLTLPASSIERGSRPVKAKAAVIQMNISDQTEENVAKGARLIKQAAAEGAEIICLPELATNVYFPFEIDPKWLALAERIPGPSTEAMCAAAREANAYVLFPMYEKHQDGELYNTAVFIDPNGSIVGKYRKTSIPLVKMAAITGIEKYYFRPGNLGFPVWPTETGVNVGTVICYDRHFPEGPRALALAGCDLMFVPTATAAGSTFWELELRAHAVANCMWVAGINRVGVDVGGGPTDFYGRDFFAEPGGEIVCQLGSEQDAILHCEIDTEVSATMRDEWGFFRDRRPDAYSALVAP
jgi:N-carbamoylputrescine amidase